MDEHGYFNFGPTNSENLTCMRTVGKVAVEVVPSMPRCLGGQCEAIHISEVDAIIEATDEQKIFAAPDNMPGPSEVEMQIAENILPYMKDGCCIQLGIGGLPNALAACIAQSDLKDLGAHTEMLVDGYVDMIESGQMNGRKKQIDKGKAVYTFAIGTQRMYDWMNNNPQVASYNVEYTNDPRRIAANDNFISINQAMQIDMFSNVNAESMGTNHITGNGGMLDYTLGAQWSNGGCSFVCLPSTQRQGRTALLPHRRQLRIRNQPHFDPSYDRLYRNRIRRQENARPEYLGQSRKYDRTGPSPIQRWLGGRSRQAEHLDPDQQDRLVTPYHQMHSPRQPGTVRRYRLLLCLALRFQLP